MNPKEALVFFLPIVVVLGTLLVSFWAMMKDTRKHNKERYEHGKQMGALTAQNIGYEKAYKIADELPECAYRDGYVEGIASIEDSL